MGDAGLASVILIALLFGVFILWGRSAGGQQRLRATFGDPPVRQRGNNTSARGSKRPTTKTSPATSSVTSSREPDSSAKPTAKKPTTSKSTSSEPTTSRQSRSKNK